jgi:predicted DNA-binding transcriptional regulator AlpA
MTAPSLAPPPRPQGRLESLSGDAWLDAEQVAEILDVSVRTLHRMMATGEFPEPCRRGRKWSRWTAQTVRDWIDQLKLKQRKPR